MASNSTPIVLSLRPPAYSRPEETDLDHLIARMSSQYKGFRHVSEAELEAQVAGQVEPDLDEQDEQEEQVEEDGDDEKGSAEYVRAQKVKMITELSEAINEATLLLDSISLLQSNFNARSAEQTLSPFLKTNVPAGSLSFEQWADVPADPDQTRDNELVSKGWRLQKLASSADTLLGAAKRLEDNVRKETRYWEQALSMQKSEDWPVYAYPRQLHLMSMRVVSKEAGQAFKERGTGTLRMDEENDLYLAFPRRPLPKNLRVRISKHSKVVGTWITRSNSISASELVTEALRARDTLMYEELLFELWIEARELRGLGVVKKDNTLVLPVATQLEQKEDGLQILIDLVDDSEDIAEMQDQASDGMTSLAQGCAIALRMLLSQLHHHRYLKRSRPQPAMSEKRKDEQPPAIIKPLLKALYHQHSVKQVDTLIQETSELLAQADINVKALSDGDSQDSVAMVSFKSRDSQLDEAQKPNLATFALQLPSCLDDAAVSESDLSDGNKLSMRIMTQISVASFGPSYSLEIPARIAEIFMSRPEGVTGLISKVEYSTAQEMTKAFCQCLSLDITRFYICPLLGETEWEGLGWKPVVVKSGAGKAASKYQTSEGHGSKLQIELCTVSSRTTEVSLQLKASYHDAGKGTTEVETWTRGNGNEKSLKEVVEKWVR
jgi:mediator of RNA polymerase II transcription subunit 17